MTNNTKIKVKNRSFGSVGYTIPDLNNLQQYWIQYTRLMNKRNNSKGEKENIFHLDMT